MKALFLGSIGVLAETSDMQRNAFNTAFAEAGLDWHWSQQTYAKLLKTAGGADRIAQEAARRGQKVDAAALHRRKSALFQERLQAGVPLRPGIAATLGAARDAGHRIALVTSTSAANVAALLGATGLAADSFDLVLTRNDAPATKPDPGIYHAALGRLGVAPDAVCAVEDNPDGLAAARAAGLTCVGFPGAMHDDADFQQAAIVLSTLSLDAITAAAG